MVLVHYLWFMEEKKIVYIAHPIGGDVKGNLEEIKRLYTAISRECPEVIPFVPYWIACHALDDTNAGDRKIGFEQNKAFFERGIIDEVWVYGMSPGVYQEMEWASEYGIKIVFRV